MRALLDGDLNRARELSGVPLTGYFTTGQARWLWDLRLRQLAEDPASGRWFARIAVTTPDGAVVGHAGFHGPPDEAGTVEVGYSVVPEHRRRGHATAMLAELLRLAASEPDVRTVRASISPGNAGSLATVARFGFVRVGEQWDEEDGLETVFEVPAVRGAAPL
ncbi:GNAT family protein [Streptomyces sp. 549]|nr:GNAT family protein [Streptomyces sp. 549]MDK1474809.1 GNAT family protein [Streptomyces sp. 549]